MMVTMGARRSRSKRGWSRRIRAVSVVATMLLVLAMPAAPAMAATTFTPAADSYVDGSNPTRNYGNRSFLRVDASPDRLAYLRFQVTGVGQPGSSLLRIFAATSNDGISVYSVPDNTWVESTITYGNRPAVGTLIGASSGPVAGGSWVDIDVSSFIQGDGEYTVAVTSQDTTALKLDSSEGTNSPQLLVPAPPPVTEYTVAGSGSAYTATSDTSPPTVFSGTLKEVVEAAAIDLERFGGGEIIFGAGLFDLGTDHFEFDDVDSITFTGQGTGVTTLVNNTSEADDTEIFDMVHADHVVIRDMTLAAGGADRSTSDAIDFDDGRNSVVSNVEITDSRGKGIVFDGKGVGWSATGNRVSGCTISGVPGDGIELLASSDNTIENCAITATGGHGIQVTKASSVAAVPNKPSDRNIVRLNQITAPGRDGININSGDDNIIVGNSISNSSQATTGRDGIRIESFNGVSCDRTDIESNALTDDQPIATQTYGINVAKSECTSTVIGSANTFSGNRLGEIKNNGTNTNLPGDTTAPSTPTSVVANAASAFEVAISWDPSTDNVGVTGYTIYRDSVEIGTVDGQTTAFYDTTVSPNTSYGYTIDAFDAVANRSAPSSPPANVTTPGVPSSFTVPAEADAYVNASSTTINYGSSTQLRADLSPELRSFIRFTVDTGGAPVSSATFRIRADSNHSQGFSLVAVPDNSWNETTITHATAPVPGTQVATSGPLLSGQYVDIDVTPYVTTEGTYSFALVGLNNTNMRLSSRETGAGPELAITLP